MNARNQGFSISEQFASKKHIFFRVDLLRVIETQKSVAKMEHIFPVLPTAIERVEIRPLVSCKSSFPSDSCYYVALLLLYRFTAIFIGKEQTILASMCKCEL